LTPIPGYEGLYSVTRDGRVWSHPKPLSGALEGRGATRGKWLTLIYQRGYRVVRLANDGVHRNESVHRLVALAFIARPHGAVSVNHLNGKKSDNRPENLEWCTQADNNRHAWRTGLMRPVRGLSEMQARICRRLVGRLTSQELGRIFGCGSSTVNRAIHGVGGYATSAPSTARG